MSLKVKSLFFKIKNNIFYLCFAMALLSSSNLLLSQEKYNDYKKERSSQTSLRSSRNYTRGLAKPSGTLDEEGLVKYRKIAMHDGNLVTGPIINSGLISYSGIGDDIRIGWPKGTKWARYIWGSYFYVAGEVVDASGDTIHIVSDDFDIEGRYELAPDGSHVFCTMPLPKYYNLDIPGSLETPLVYGISEDVGKDGFPRTNDEGEGDGELQSVEDFNGNGELDLQMENTVGWFAISHRKETWPEYWPAGSYPGDTRPDSAEYAGDRAGRWNGEYGAYTRADQESYYVMVDRENDEFEYYPFPGDTASWPTGRRGLGLTTEARAYQWNSRLAEDILISIFEISLDLGAKDIDRSVVGMYIDPDMGGGYTSDDASFDALDDITYSWNRTFLSTEGLPLGYFGFAFLESPGLGFDGIDNDADGWVDERQDDGIDNDGDWLGLDDLNGNGVYDYEDKNYNGILDPGEDDNLNGRLDAEPLRDDLGSDGLGPDFFEYTGPDANGTEANGIKDLGEPNFEFTDNDESDQVGLTSFYLVSTQAPQGIYNDEHFWDSQVRPGTFAIVPGYQSDISYAYGSGYIKFNSAERNHRYAIALVFGNDFEDIFRNKRTMQVIYDNDYNFAKPPVQPTLEALGDDKRVYLSWDSRSERSKDPIYGSDFEAYYVYKSTEPAFTEIKTITDAFGNPFLFKPLAIFDKVNGLSGLHPVNIGSEIGSGSNLGVTYDMGTDSGLEHKYLDTDVTNGRTYYYAIGAVDNGYHPDFYEDSISVLEQLSPISPTECAINIQTDPLGRPISFDPNTAAVIPSERSSNWVMPSISAEGFEHISGNGTGRIEVEFYSPLEIQTGYKYRIEFDDNGTYEQYDSSHYTGVLNKIMVSSITENKNLLTEENPINVDLHEKYIMDGFRLILHNDTSRIDTTLSKWTSGSSPLHIIDLSTSVNTTVGRDYEIRVLDSLADSTISRKPVNFQIWDVTDPDDQFKMKFMMFDKPPLKYLGDGDKITINNRANSGLVLWTFEFEYPDNIDSTLMIEPQNGDVFKIVTKKTYDREDVIEFSLEGNIINANASKDVLNNIYTVPDPYVAVNTLERRVINEEEGRGDRRIDFVNLPQKCTISIYTVSGKLVRELDHYATEKNKRRSWDLRTKDGLEIAYGMYFYVVDAPGIGTKTGKFAVIK